MHYALSDDDDDDDDELVDNSMRRQTHTSSLDSNANHKPTTLSHTLTPSHTQSYPQNP